jgi:hypothetical protein
MAPVAACQTNASATPFVSPGTRFEACDTKATQLGGWLRSPLTAGAYEGPFAGPPMPCDTRAVSPTYQGEPSLE